MKTAGSGWWWCVQSWIGWHHGVRCAVAESRQRLLLLVCACASLLVVPFTARAHAVIPWENVAVSQVTIKHDNTARSALVLRPTTQPQGTLAPALILLHYVGGTAADMADFAEAGRMTRDNGAWVIVPQGINGTWNYQPHGLSQVDDVGFLAALIQQAVKNHPIDAHRIYMAGYSDGGLMTQRFACAEPGLIAAGGSVAANLYKGLAKACSPSQGTPMLFIAGKKDQTVPYDGNVFFLSAPDSAAFWAKLDGCTAPPVRSKLPPGPVDDGTRVVLDRYAGCPHGGVALYSVIGGGHTWPGAYPYSPQLGATTHAIDADTVLWKFFDRYTRP